MDPNYFDYSAPICNPVHLYRIRQNRTSTRMYWYMSVHELHTSTYWFVPVRTLNKTCGFLIHPGSVLSLSLRVKYNSVHLLCKRYYRMMSNFKKCKVQVSTYWSILVRIYIDINRKHASMESRSNRFPTPTSLNCTLDLFLARSVLLQGSLLYSQTTQVWLRHNQLAVFTSTY